MSGFLAERGVHADAVVRSGGVLVGGVFAGGGQAAARGSGGAGSRVVRPAAAWADLGAVSAGVSGDGAVGVDRWAPEDRDGDLHPVDGAQGSLPVGVSVVGGGGVGLDSFAAVLSDLARGAGAGRVDGQKAHPADGPRDGVEHDSDVDLDRDARAALPAAGGPDRLDGGRGRHQVSDRFGAGVAWGAGAGARGSQTGPADRRAGAAGAWRPAGGGAGGAGGAPALRGGQGRGAQAHGADRRAVGALGQGGQATGEGDAVQGAWARREGEAARGGQAGGVGGSLGEGRGADPPARGGGADQRSDR